MKTITLKTVNEQGELIKENIIQLNDGAILIHRVNRTNNYQPTAKWINGIHNYIKKELSNLDENNINLITVPEWSSFEIIDNMEE